MLERYKDGKEYRFEDSEVEGFLRWNGSIGFWEITYPNYKGDLNQFHWLERKGRITDYEIQRQGSGENVTWRISFLTDNRAMIVSLLNLRVGIDQKESWWSKRSKKMGDMLDYLLKDPYLRILDDQIEKVLAMGYHKAIGMTEKHFLQKLNISSLYSQIRCQIAIEKEYGLKRQLNYLARSLLNDDFTNATIHDRPLVGDILLLLVIHDCLVPFEVQADLAGIEVEGWIHPWELSRFEMSPPFAHLLFDVNDGGNMSYIPFDAGCVLRQMGRRGLTTEEGLAFISQYPEKLTKFFDPNRKGQRLYLMDRLAGDEEGDTELCITTYEKQGERRARLGVDSLCIGGAHQKVPSCRGKSPIFPRKSLYYRCEKCYAFAYCKDKTKITPPNLRNWKE